MTGVDMDFSEALKAMGMGSKIAREAWRGHISHWQLLNGAIWQAKPDGNLRDMPSLPTVDILADDWWIVP